MQGYFSTRVQHCQPHNLAETTGTLGLDTHESPC